MSGEGDNILEQVRDHLVAIRALLSSAHQGHVEARATFARLQKALRLPFGIGTWETSVPFEASNEACAKLDHVIRSLDTHLERTRAVTD